MLNARQYSEAELILHYNLERFEGDKNIPLLNEWLCQENQIELNSGEQYLFNLIFFDAREKIEFWHKEELKMKFIAFVLKLGGLVDNTPYHTYFKRTIKAMVNTRFLKMKVDFMMAKGFLNQPQNPYFHLQVWKKYRNPAEDPIAQLLTAFLISQEVNQNTQPMYGCIVTGKFWEFIIMLDNNYCISESYDCTEEESLISIITILRRFSHRLHYRCLN